MPKLIATREFNSLLCQWGLCYHVADFCCPREGMKSVPTEGERLLNGNSRFQLGSKIVQPSERELKVRVLTLASQATPFAAPLWRVLLHS